VTLKFLYKIHSGYDGFRPAAIPNRLQDQQLLRLGWTRYLDTVELAAEVWIYFHGPHRFDNGVYVKGIVRNIDRAGASVLLRVREYSTTAPLTDDATTQRVAAVVAPRYRQVFLFPTELEPVPACDVATAAATCRQRLCEACPTWKALPLIQASDVAVPQRLTELIPQVVSAYWVIPARCYLHGEYKPICAGVRRTSELFYRFKVGEENLAFPLALAMFAALRDRGLLRLDFDAVVPIPLSPDKAGRGEIHRTRLLARELGRLLGVRTVELLQLNRPLSKRTLGLGQLAFERRYHNALDVSQAVHRYQRLMLVDDVVTHGSTLLAAASRLRKVNPTLELAAVTAGQMILKASVINEARIVA
jgi:predicted amidophosphoribosyltransferase